MALDPRGSCGFVGALLFGMALFLAPGVALCCTCATVAGSPLLAEQMPDIQRKDSVVFVGVVERLVPEIVDFDLLWRRIFREERPADPSFSQMRNFCLRLPAEYFTSVERNQVGAAKTKAELDAVLEKFERRERRVTLRIMETFGPHRRGSILVYTGYGGGDCGVDFESGQRWLVVAFRDTHGRISTGICSATGLAAERQKTIKSLRELNR